MSDLNDLIRECKTLKLEDMEILDDYTFEQISKIYNGIGPEKFPGPLRHLITALHPSFAAASLIHDLEYSRGGSRAEFRQSNQRLGRNAVKTVKAHYRRLNPMRYILTLKALRFAWYCQMLGNDSWKLKKSEKESNFTACKDCKND